MKTILIILGVLVLLVIAFVVCCCVIVGARAEKDFYRSIEEGKDA